MNEATQAQCWMEELSNIGDAGRRRRFLESQGGASRELISILYDETLRLGRLDLERAQRVAEALTWAAEDLANDHARAQAFRANGHILYLRDRYEAAVECYQRALELFDQLDEQLEAARTISASLQSLAYLGRYETAYGLAQRARKVFAEKGERERLARLEGNLGNMLYRQDRLQEALDHYLEAHHYFAAHDTEPDLGVNLRNMAVCYISLAQFEQALEAYSQFREYAVRHDLPVMAVQADYNIAYLYYLRGDYTQAIDVYDHTRECCEKLKQPYHRALCDLDQAEMYLELNLVEQAVELGARAVESFGQLGLGYEAAKALAFVGIGNSRLGEPERALEDFDRARTIFLRESNRVWPALLDLYKALVHLQQGEYARARSLCSEALDFFRESPLTGKAAICELLLARLDIAAGRPQDATAHCEAGLGLAAMAEMPATEFHAHMVLGQALEAQGLRDSAYEAYERAHHALEKLRSQLFTEEVKVAFIKDKLSLYEGLVELALERGADGAAAAFGYIERAKSRSLADLIAFRVHALPPAEETAEHATSRVRTLHEKLAWSRRQSTREPLHAEPPSPERMERLRQQTRNYEGEFSRAAGDLESADRELSALLNAGTQSLQAIREKIPDDSVIVEYYEGRGTIYACVVGRSTLNIVRAADAAELKELVRLLQFQLSKFAFGAAYVKALSSVLESATRSHLRELYRRLITPVRQHLEAKHLIIVPHGFLHHLPFHALIGEGERTLIDEFSISYSPSASVYQLCCEKPEIHAHDSLVLGVPDPQAPHILDEAHAVASVLPNARLFIGESAGQEVVRRYAPDSRFVHIATHGMFRYDNPMFSSIRLGRSDLSLFDLYQLRLSAELATLSGCGTGLNVVTGGDELQGLVRGLLYAGARCVLLTLWDVNDESTAEFMNHFYERMMLEANKAIAVQKTMQWLRQSRPHPYFWAPFMLIGKHC